MTAAYPKRPSVRAGETLQLCVSTDEPCVVHFFRCGAQIEEMHDVPKETIPPQPCAIGEAGRPWNWPIYRFKIPSSWRSGIYIACFGHTPTDGTHLDARSHRALFVVRPQAPAQSPIAYNLPFFTFAAYNVGLDRISERTSLYNHAPAVTLERPGNGIGGHTWDEKILDAYDPATPRQTFAHWDLKAIQWLESRAIAPDYLCDFDMHADPAALQGYELLLAFGHHEYWTDAMRESLDAHLNRGGNAAFFTGNTSYFRIRYDDATAAISRLGRWSDGRPEEHTFGVSYRFGGGKWRGERPPSGYRISDPKHPIFEGCDIDDGRVIGADRRLIGYECDGAPPERNGDFEALASADLTGWPVTDGSGEVMAGGHATMGIRHHARGELFIAGTVDWPRVLAQRDVCVGRITANLVRRLAPSLPRISSLV